MSWVGIKNKSNPRDTGVFTGENESRIRKEGFRGGYFTDNSNLQGWVAGGFFILISRSRQETILAPGNGNVALNLKQRRESLNEAPDVFLEGWRQTGLLADGRAGGGRHHGRGALCGISAPVGLSSNTD